jgi:hypothetical protein
MPKFLPRLAEDEPPRYSSQQEALPERSGGVRLIFVPSTYLTHYLSNACWLAGMTRT